MDSAHRDDGESLLNFRGSEIQGDWRFLGHPSDQMGYSSSSAMVATFGTTLNPQTAMAEIRAGLASQSGGGIFPQNPRQLSTEPSFGQWAPRPSSFPGFSSSPSSGAAMAIPVEDFQRRNPKNDGGHEGENRAEGNHEEDPGSSPGSINRKRKRENLAADEGKNSSAEPPPKEDYVHVRARRGQATNSHSLAERVRREKISERMKFLQDLVPGCSKVTGKALMLDEIINYVQSLQRQVEFLSMKLATVNPPFDFNIDGMFLREISSIAHAQFMNAALQPANQTASWPDELLNFHGGHLKAQR